MVDSRKGVADRFTYDIKSPPIGEGHFSKVYKGFDKLRPGVPVAIKLITTETLKQYEGQGDIFDREVKILERIVGDTFLRSIASFKDERGLHLVMDYCEGDSLSKKIKDLTEGQTFPEEDALDIAYEVAYAFYSLPKIGLKTESGKPATLIHRDIKPGNLLFKEGKIKIVDFGLSEIIEDETKNNQVFNQDAGTLFWMSPQILKKLVYSSKTDVFSLGVVLYEMLHGDVPWGKANHFILAERVLTKTPVIKKTLKPETIHLLKSMLSTSEEDRPGWDELVQHPAFAEAKERVARKKPVQKPINSQSVMIKFDEKPVQADSKSSNLTASMTIVKQPPLKVLPNGIEILSQNFKPKVYLFENAKKTVRILPD